MQHRRSLRCCIDTLRHCEAANILDPINTRTTVHFPSTHLFAALSSSSLIFCCYFYRFSPLDRLPWLPRSQPQPNNSDPAPPRGRHHPLRKIHIDSFPRRSSGSITSLYSTAHSSRNVDFPPQMGSSTSLSRTVAGRRFVLPRSRSGLGSARVLLQFAFQGRHHCLRSGLVGRV